MKKLTELGISPMPWELIPYAESTETKKPTLGEVESNGENIFCEGLARYPDARMIKAAPKLYAALYDLITIARNRMPSKPTIEEIEALRNAEAALAEAAGESNDHHI